jgi:hypothetical protein
LGELGLGEVLWREVREKGNGVLASLPQVVGVAVELAQTESELREVDCCVGDTDPGNHAMGVLISAMLLLNGQWT